jgi:RNA polymerase sigma factor (sigma-70 family)
MTDDELSAFIKDDLLPKVARYLYWESHGKLSRDKIADLTQKTLVQFARKRPEGAPQQLRKWCYTTARNFFRSYLRSPEGREPVPIEDIFQDKRDNPERMYFKKTMWEALNLLPEEEQLVAKRRLEGFTLAEIDEELGANEGRADYLFKKAVKSLQQRYS